MEAIAKCLLVVSICLISNEAKESGADARNKQVRRWYHGCHSMIPCPPPFCDNPVYGPGNCCGYCPPDPVTSSPEVKPEAETEIAEPDDLKRHVEKVAHGKAQLGKRASQLALFTRYFTTTSPKTTTYCPYPCTHQGTQFCFPLPCYINCVDAVKPRGACCYTCQNGPNCGYNGHVIPEGGFILGPSGEEIHCITGAYDGGNIEIRQRSTTSRTVV